MREGDLRGRRVVDVGCGTGLFGAALAERHAAKVWGVDPAPEMVELARARLPAGSSARLGRAEELPFRDGWFERAVLRTVVHLVERPAAFAELRRALAPGGRVAVATFEPEHFRGFWLNGLFPSLEGIDRARFPDPAALPAELAAAGFPDARVTRLAREGALARAEALERIRRRYISTLQLLEPAEYEAGLARAERELPERIEYALRWAIVTAA